MITVIHGDDQSAGYQYLQSLLTSARYAQTEIIELVADKTSLTDFTQALESSSLFSDSKLLVVFGLFSMRKKPLQKSFFAVINQATAAPDIIILETKSLTKTQINKIQTENLVSKQFKLPIYLWKFIDYFAPATHRQALSLLLEKLNQTAPELIVFMLLRRIRQLILAQDKLSISSADWKQAKLNSQSKQFNLNQLVAYHHQLTTLSHYSKSSQNLLDIKHALTLSVLSLRYPSHHSKLN